VEPTLDLDPPVAGSWTPCRAVVAVLADEVLARPELLRAAAEAIVFRSEGEIVVYAPGADPAAIAPAIEALLADAGLDGDDTEVSLLCVPAEVGDAAMCDAGATVVGSRPASPVLGALPRLDLDAAWVLRPVAQLDRLWVGDSHATYFARKPLHHATPADRGEAAAWLGPRLMFSLARDGFPDPLTPHLDGATVEVRSLALAAGEIDCRVHLAERVAQGDRLDFVGRYVERAVELRDRLGAEDVVLVGPVPPSDVGLEHPAHGHARPARRRDAAARAPAVRGGRAPRRPHRDRAADRRRPRGAGHRRAGCPLHRGRRPRQPARRERVRAGL
jgi:hypothetical protein